MSIMQSMNAIGRAVQRFREEENSHHETPAQTRARLERYDREDAADEAEQARRAEAVGESNEAEDPRKFK